MSDSGDLTIKLKGEILHLLPERAIWWPARKTLLLGDLHLGKSGHFRANGIAIPNQVNASTLSRFEAVVRKFCPQRIYFLGDLFHSTYNKEWKAFEEVLKGCETENYLIKGNHDILPKEKYREAGLQVVDERIELGPFLLSHEPPVGVQEGTYALSAHIHPGVRLVGLGRQKLRLPCFYFEEKKGILPAFGSFTGLFMVNPEEAKAIFAVVDKEVIQVHGEKPEPT